MLNVGHCHPRVVEAIRDQAGRLTHATNLYYTEPALRLSEALATSSLGGKVFLTNSGTEAIEAAIKLARRARPGGEVVVLEGAFHGRTYGSLSATPQESKQAPFAPLVPGFVGRPEGPGRARGGGRRAHRGGAARADPGRERDPRRRRRAARGGARGVRPDRGGAHLRRDPDRHGPHRDALGLRADRRRPGRADDRQGARRRRSDRRARHRRAARGHVPARRSRLDVRGRPGRLAGGARGARDLLRPGACSSTSGRPARSSRRGSSDYRTWRPFAAAD